MAELGFIGLGVMGGNLVSRLMERGHTIVGHNRTRARAEALIAQGMKWADSPREVCQEANVILSMVSNSKALGEIAEGQNGMLAGLGEGKDLVVASTVNQAFSRWLASKVSA